MGWIAVFLAYILGRHGLSPSPFGAPAPSPRVPPPRPHPGRVPHSHAPPARRPVPPSSDSRRGSTPAATTPARAPATVPAALTAPWPQVVPSGLPAFPGAGWELDNPPPPAVVSRAQQLLNPLWQGGAGTFKAENTAGRWIVYRATQMDDKKGVVAFRESQHAPFLATQDSPAPTAQPASTPVVRASAPASSTSLPLLQLTHPNMSGPDVKVVQQKLGLVPADGFYGPQTAAAVKAFQQKNSLTPDGKVGNQTWAALLGRSSA